MMRRVVWAWADDAATFATELARIEPAWGSETFELAGGHVVLCGPGMFVNRAIAVGLDGPLSTISSTCSRCEAQRSRCRRPST